MNEHLPLLGLGLLLGLRHATDADHVVAVTAIAARTRSVLPATRLGIVWGLGHSLTLFTVGAGIIVFNWVVPPRVGLALEFAVALALVSVGLVNLSRSRREAAAKPKADMSLPARRAFVVGLVHGLAGSAAVALLVLATVREPWLGCLYLFVFAVGTVAGMALVTSGFAFPVAASAARWQPAPRLVSATTGLLSLAFGLWLAYQIGWADGLFSAAPHWRAH